MGSFEEKQVIYDVLQRKIVGTIGTPEALPNPEGDISLSSSGEWLANGLGEGTQNFYTIISLNDGKSVRTEGVNKGEYSGDIRIDPVRKANRIIKIVILFIDLY